jgi:hypothetical protein
MDSTLVGAHARFPFRALALSIWGLVCCSTARAEPPPVAAGLWEVELLTTFTQLQGASSGAPLAPHKRGYRICIDERRAAAPMIGRAAPARAEVLYDRQTISGTGFHQGADGRQRPVEFAYRRIDDKRFEGSHDAETPTHVVHTQYLARWIGVDCGALAPQSPQGLAAP